MSFVQLKTKTVTVQSASNGWLPGTYTFDLGEAPEQPLKLTIANVPYTDTFQSAAVTQHPIATGAVPTSGETLTVPYSSMAVGSLMVYSTPTPYYMNQSTSPVTTVKGNTAALAIGGTFLSINSDATLLATGSRRGKVTDNVPSLEGDDISVYRRNADNSLTLIHVERDCRFGQLLSNGDLVAIGTDGSIKAAVYNGTGYNPATTVRSNVHASAKLLTPRGNPNLFFVYYPDNTFARSGFEAYERVNGAWSQVDAKNAPYYAIPAYSEDGGPAIGGGTQRTFDVDASGNRIVMCVDTGQRYQGPHIAVLDRQGSTWTETSRTFVGDGDFGLRISPDGNTIMRTYYSDTGDARLYILSRETDGTWTEGGGWYPQYYGTNKSWSGKNDLILGDCDRSTGKLTILYSHADGVRREVHVASAYKTDSQDLANTTGLPIAMTNDGLLCFSGNKNVTAALPSPSITLDLNWAICQVKVKFAGRYLKTVTVGFSGGNPTVPAPNAVISASGVTGSLLTGWNPITLTGEGYSNSNDVNISLVDYVSMF